MTDPAEIARGLSNEETYCLGLLAEEMGEALQLIGKALRFGLDTPGVKRLDGTIDMALTPRNMLSTELGDAMAAIAFAHEHGICSAIATSVAYLNKFAKLTDPEARDNLGGPLAPWPPRQHLKEADDAE